MIDYIRKAFKNNMHKLDWMNEETKKVAFEKVNFSLISVKRIQKRFTHQYVYCYVAVYDSQQLHYIIKEE